MLYTLCNIMCIVQCIVSATWYVKSAPGYDSYWVGLWSAYNVCTCTNPTIEPGEARRQEGKKACMHACTHAAKTSLDYPCFTPQMGQLWLNKCDKKTPKIYIKKFSVNSPELFCHRLKTSLTISLTTLTLSLLCYCNYSLLTHSLAHSLTHSITPPPHYRIFALLYCGSGTDSTVIVTVTVCHSLSNATPSLPHSLTHTLTHTLTHQ